MSQLERPQPLVGQQRNQPVQVNTGRRRAQLQPQGVVPEPVQMSSGQRDVMGILAVIGAAGDVAGTIGTIAAANRREQRLSEAEQRMVDTHLRGKATGLMQEITPDLRKQALAGKITRDDIPALIEQHGAGRPPAFVERLSHEMTANVNLWTQQYAEDEQKRAFDESLHTGKSAILGAATAKETVEEISTLGETYKLSPDAAIRRYALLALEAATNEEDLDKAGAAASRIIDSINSTKENDSFHAEINAAERHLTARENGALNEDRDRVRKAVIAQAEHDPHGAIERGKDAVANEMMDQGDYNTLAAKIEHNYRTTRIKTLEGDILAGRMTINEAMGEFIKWLHFPEGDIGAGEMWEFNRIRAANQQFKESNALKIAVREAAAGISVVQMTDHHKRPIQELLMESPEANGLGNDGQIRNARLFGNAMKNFDGVMPDQFQSQIEDRLLGTNAKEIGFAAEIIAWLEHNGAMPPLGDVALMKYRYLQSQTNSDAMLKEAAGGDVDILTLLTNAAGAVVNITKENLEKTALDPADAAAPTKANKIFDLAGIKGRDTVWGIPFTDWLNRDNVGEIGPESLSVVRKLTEYRNQNLAFFQSVHAPISARAKAEELAAKVAVDQIRREYVIGNYGDDFWSSPLYNNSPLLILDLDTMDYIEGVVQDRKMGIDPVTKMRFGPKLPDGTDLDDYYPTTDPLIDGILFKNIDNKLLRYETGEPFKYVYGEKEKAAELIGEDAAFNRTFEAKEAKREQRDYDTTKALDATLKLMDKAAGGADIFPGASEEATEGRKRTVYLRKGNVLQTFERKVITDPVVSPLKWHKFGEAPFDFSKITEDHHNWFKHRMWEKIVSDETLSPPPAAFMIDPNMQMSMFGSALESVSPQDKKKRAVELAKRYFPQGEPPKGKQPPLELLFPKLKEIPQSDREEYMNEVLRILEVELKFK